MGSGDLFTPQDCLDMIAQTGVDGVTIARGAIGNPWIFAQVRALAAGRVARAAQLRRAARDYGRALSAGRGALRPEAHASAACGSSASSIRDCIPQAEQVRDAFVAIGSLADWQAVLEKWYG